MRRWLSLSFHYIEDVIYVGLGLLLAGVAGALLIAEITYFIQYLLSGQLSENIVMLLDYSSHHHFLSKSFTSCRFPFASMCCNPDRFWSSA